LRIQRAISVGGDDAGEVERVRLQLVSLIADHGTYELTPLAAAR
jgi:hypothetical protein